jgi:hypothetical protein
MALANTKQSTSKTTANAIVLHSFPLFHWGGDKKATRWKPLPNPCNTKLGE